MKERLPKEVRLNGTCSSGADDDRNDRVLLRYTDTNSGSILLTVTLGKSPPKKTDAWNKYRTPIFFVN